MQNIHYFPLTSQGNIYTFTMLHLANNTNKLLIASLRREVLCFEYQENSLDILIPSTKEISFTYIPNGAEIISMDSFNKSDTSSNDFVIGITIIKHSNDLHALETYLNIYSGWEESVEFNMETISQNCLHNIELKYIPYHLTHTHFVQWNEDKINNKEVVFLLSGSDNKVHVYQENKSNHTYKELECKEHFPEFIKPQSVVTWIDIIYYNNYEERVTAFGCECGYIRLCRVCVKTSKILYNFSTRFENSISSVKLYSIPEVIEPPNCLKDDYIFKSNKTDLPLINLVVVNSLLPAVFFGDILKYGLRKYGTLPRSELTTVFSCVEVADINLDGSTEILIGNSNQEIISYKFDEKQGWVLLDIRKFPAPIFSIKHVDVTGDGVKELLILTMKGVHVLQHEPSFVQHIIEERINNLIIPNVKSLALE